MMNRNRRPIPRFFNIESQIIIDTIIKKKYYPVSLKKVLKKNIKQASKSKINFKDTLAHDLSPDIFYVQEGDLRNQTLFYEFIYGHESKIAGTGLRESHFESASKYFETIFRDIYPGGPLNFHEINLCHSCNSRLRFLLA